MNNQSILNFPQNNNEQGNALILSDSDIGTKERNKSHFIKDAQSPNNNNNNNNVIVEIESDNSSIVIP